MSAAGRTVFRGVAHAVLDGSLPLDANERNNLLDAHILHVEATVLSFSQATQAELSQLLALLAYSPGRRAIAGLRNDWPASSVGEIQMSLQDMRTSKLELRQQAYHALRDLTNAAFYAQPEAWSATGYPGPRDI